MCAAGFLGRRFPDVAVREGCVLGGVTTMGTARVTGRGGRTSRSVSHKHQRGTTRDSHGSDSMAVAGAHFGTHSPQEGGGRTVATGCGLAPKRKGKGHRRRFAQLK